MRFTLDYIIGFSASLGYFRVASRDSRRLDFGALHSGPSTTFSNAINRATSSSPSPTSPSLSSSSTSSLAPPSSPFDGSSSNSASSLPSAASLTSATQQHIASSSSWSFSLQTAAVHIVCPPSSSSSSSSHDAQTRFEEMPRRPSRRIGGTSRPTGEDASTSSEPPRVRTKIGVARPPRRGVHASSSTSIRQRPTASERRRKMVQDPLPEPVDEDIESSSEDDSSGDEAGPSSPPQLATAAGDGPIPGGPADLSVLVSIRTHVAISIWDGEERGPLKCISHWRQLKDWYIPLPEDGLDLYVPMFRAIIDESGLADLRRFSYRYISSPLVLAFVERWQPETNTFHMPFGEMTITLDDVRTLLGIPVTGLPIHVSTSMGFTEQVDLLERGLGVDRASAAAELNLARGGVVRMGWIRRVCGDISPASSVEEVECAARGYLLYLLGCTLFTDKSATRVPIYYLSLLMDLTRVRDYAWGAAALAYLYRQLGTATRADVRQIAGYLTLLTSWVYEHFPFTRPPAQWG
ncbi:serine/threonine-protein phosphatase 7 long form [Cinnamomum micranthum f. kanehirae]|uniref:Serine/threonine-protein phosphatase 7 long form n=1 Tax=Cinnamomum micranthum f. kanehirae TaxID=337451 RepID=A0A3S3RAF9_9MAGN|nr:serine/threonine-protein phosphatase 7 long form [Cinnamomum micranthum f. kanehirae]